MKNGCKKKSRESGISERRVRRVCTGQCICHSYVIVAHPKGNTGLHVCAVTRLPIIRNINKQKDHWEDEDVCGRMI
jgi:hypothetical protein